MNAAYSCQSKNSVVLAADLVITERAMGLLVSNTRARLRAASRVVVEVIC